MIVAVAIRHSDGRLFSLPKPARHSHVLPMAGTIVTEAGKKKWALYDGEAGFLDEEGNFLNRDDGWWHAVEAGQIDYDDCMLCSGEACVICDATPGPDKNCEHEVTVRHGECGHCLSSEHLW